MASAWTLLWLVAAALATDVRGMTVSTPTWGWEWGTDTMASSLTELRADGVNWVSIHPYARIEGDGTVAFRPIDPDAPPEWLVRPIREAHARSMRIRIKPHLAYWGSPFSWRGEIAFEDEEALDRFFATYEAWMTAIARAVGDADGLCVGTELDRLTPHDARWRKVIAALREVYEGPLTYAANWDAADRVPFWDAVDVIGVQAYYPILEAVSDAVPPPGVLDAGWDRVLGKLRALSRAHGDRPVVFTEVGYDASPAAPVKPWRGGHGQHGTAMQRACTEAALRAIDREPVVIGAFLWKWFPGELPMGDFRMSRPDMRAVIREMWAPR